MRGVGDVEAHHRAPRRHRHDVVMTADDGNRARRVLLAREGGDEPSLGTFAGEPVHQVEPAVEGGDQHRLAVGHEARLRSRRAFIATRPVGQVEGREQFEVGEPPELHGVHLLIAIHVGCRGHEPIERCDDGRGVRPDAPVHAGPVGRDAPNHLSRWRDLREATGRDALRVMLHLEGREHVAARQPHIAVRVHHAGRVAELRHDARLGRIGHVEDEGLPSSEAVGEQAAVGRHRVLGVVWLVVASGHWHGGHERAVTSRHGAHVEHGQEVGLGGVGRCGPEIQIRGRTRGVGRGARRLGVEHRCTGRQQRDEGDGSHEGPSGLK